MDGSVADAFVFTDLGSALRRTLELINQATANSGAKLVQDAVYQAEKGLFTKMQDVALSASVEDALVEYAKSLSDSGKHVEQIRLQGAEMAEALGRLSRQSNRLGEVLRQQVRQLLAQERSVAVRQCLERVSKLPQG